MIDQGVGLAQLIKDYVYRHPENVHKGRRRVIAGHLRAMVDDGIFAPDDLLPTSSTLSECYREAGLPLSPAGCQKVYQLLREGGAVYTRHSGDGTRVKAPRVPLTRRTVPEPTTYLGNLFDSISRRMRLVVHYDVLRTHAPQLIVGLLGHHEDVFYRARVLGDRDRRELLHQAWVPGWVADSVPAIASRMIGAGNLASRIESQLGPCHRERYEFGYPALVHEAHKLGVPFGTELRVAATVTVIEDQRPVLVTTRAMQAARFEPAQVSRW